MVATARNRKAVAEAMRTVECSVLFIALLLALIAPSTDDRLAVSSRHDRGSIYRCGVGKDVVAHVKRGDYATTDCEQAAAMRRFLLAAFLCAVLAPPAAAAEVHVRLTSTASAWNSG